MRQETNKGVSALFSIMESLGKDELYFFLGVGDTRNESFLQAAMFQFENFLFVNGYDNRCADALYASGDIFLMPSSFEPCGISQILAMKAGQPCVVHSVGGLRDTIEDGVSGFAFSGETLEEQATAFVATVNNARNMFRSDRQQFDRIRLAASQSRFTWRESVCKYVIQLYGWPTPRPDCWSAKSERKTNA